MVKVGGLDFGRLVFRDLGEVVPCPLSPLLKFLLSSLGVKLGDALGIETPLDAGNSAEETDEPKERS